LLASGLVPVLSPWKKQGSDLGIIFSFTAGGGLLALAAAELPPFCELIAKSFKLCSRASTLTPPSELEDFFVGTSTTRRTALPSMTLRTFSMSQSFLLDVGVGTDGEEKASQKDEVSLDMKVCETREAMTACWGV